MEDRRLPQIAVVGLLIAAAVLMLGSACAPGPASPTAAPKSAATAALTPAVPTKAAEAPAATQPAAAAKPAGPARVWRVHIPWTKDNPVTAGVVDPWAKEVFEKTGGAIKPEVYYSGALGIKGPEALRVAQQGSLEVRHGSTLVDSLALRRARNCQP